MSSSWKGSLRTRSAYASYTRERTEWAVAGCLRGGGGSEEGGEEMATKEGPVRALSTCTVRLPAERERKAHAEGGLGKTGETEEATVCNECTRLARRRRSFVGRKAFAPAEVECA